MDKKQLETELFDLFARFTSNQLSDKFSSKHEYMDNTKTVLRHTLSECIKRKWRTHATIWNICLFIDILAHDLSLLVRDLVLNQENWERRFTARHLALLAYECVEDLQTLLGKRFRQSLSKLDLLNEFEPSLGNEKKPLNDFWKKHRSSLKFVRNTTAAHRDHDSLAIWHVIENIDVNYFISLGMELSTILNDISSFLQSVIAKASEIEPPEITSPNS